MSGKIAWTNDDFSDARERSTRAAYGRFGIARLPVAAVIVAGLVAAAVVGGIVTWLVSGDERTAANSPPLIKADEKPIKVHPASPGGLEVPNRDKLVYSRLKDGGESGGEVERLSPAPEEPLTPPTVLPPEAQPVAPPSSRSPTGSPFPSEGVGSLETPRIGEPVPAPAPTPLPEPSVAAVKPVPAAPASKPAARAEKPAAQAEKPAAKPGTPPAATKRDSANATGAGKLYVQLLASRSQADALDAWKKLQSNNGDLLGGLGSSVARADLGDRGVYYRLRAGPIASEARAKSLCSALAGRKVSCLIVRTGA